jgi:hypothetical protein
METKKRSDFSSNNEIASSKKDSSADWTQAQNSVYFLSSMKRGLLSGDKEDKSVKFFEHIL